MPERVKGDLSFFFLSFFLFLCKNVHSCSFAFGHLTNWFHSLQESSFLKTLPCKLNEDHPGQCEWKTESVCTFCLSKNIRWLENLSLFKNGLVCLFHSFFN